MFQISTSGSSALPKHKGRLLILELSRGQPEPKWPFLPTAEIRQTRADELARSPEPA